LFHGSISEVNTPERKVYAQMSATSSIDAATLAALASSSLNEGSDGKMSDRDASRFLSRFATKREADPDTIARLKVALAMHAVLRSTSTQQSFMHPLPGIDERNTLQEVLDDMELPTNDFRRFMRSDMMIREVSDVLRVDAIAAALRQRAARAMIDTANYRAMVDLAEFLPGMTKSELEAAATIGGRRRRPDKMAQKVRRVREGEIADDRGDNDDAGSHY